MPDTRKSLRTRTVEAEANVLERHACLDGVEVALVKAHSDLFAVVLLLPVAGDVPVQWQIGGLHEDGAALASRMMDMHATVCAMQHAGFALPAFLPQAA